MMVRGAETGFGEISRLRFTNHEWLRTPGTLTINALVTDLP